jgi:hypothetical protein
VTSLAYVAPERDPVDIALDLHLRSWYMWRMEYRYGKGHKAAAVTNEYRAPGHFDWANGAAQERADDLVDRAVDAAVQRMPNAPQRWRTAIEFEAMNLHCKAAVWESPYLPTNPHERETLVLEARNMLLRELRSAGVMT